MKTLIKLLLFAVLCVLQSPPAWGRTWTYESDGVYYELYQNGSTHQAWVTAPPNGLKYTGSVSIKSKIKHGVLTYEVIEIGHGAFRDCDELTNVYIPTTVKEIGSYAFAGCTQLISISLPNSIESIAEFAFWNSGLRKVTLPSSLYSIVGNAFGQCEYLEKISIDTENEYFTFENKTLFSKDKTRLIEVLYHYSGDYRVPEGVTQISSYAFYGCDNITSVTLPSTLLYLGEEVFAECSGVTAFDIPQSIVEMMNGCFKNCGKLQKVIWNPSLSEIPASTFDGCISLNEVSFNSTLHGLKSFGYRTFANCKSLKELALPEGLETIGKSVFDGCESLTKITLPKSVLNIESFAFTDCIALKALQFNENLEKIGGGAFQGCTSLSELVIPYKVKVIGSVAFSGCTSLSALTIPEAATSLGERIVEGCTLNPLSIYALMEDPNSTLKGLSSESTILARSEDVPKISSWYWKNVYPIDSPYYIKEVKSYIRGCSFEILSNPYFKDRPVQINNVFIAEEELELKPDENGIYLATNLEEKTDYTIIVLGSYLDASGKPILEEGYTSFKKPFRTSERRVDIHFDPDYSYQTKLKIQSVNAWQDITDKPSGVGVMFAGRDYEYTGSPLEFTNLAPDTRYWFTPYAYYGEERIEYESDSERTASVVGKLEASKVGPTSLVLSTAIFEGDATILEKGFKDQDDNIIPCEGEILELNGLQPNTKYEFKYFVKCKEGNQERKVSVYTPDLTLVTLPPRGVSGTCSIVAAETNILEEETNAGFEWRKYDAPESLASSQGFGMVYDGKLEGYIRNLQSTSYYKVRAFYKPAKGSTVYAGWETFDPSDFSYFEPTVHTYPAERVTFNSAYIRGYVIAGTDDITEQGFEYWINGTNDRKRTPGLNEPEISTILSKGQAMSVVLERLKPNTEYVVRSFVSTESATFYGEEQTFTTEFDPAGISDAESCSKIEIIGYYDIHGYKHTRPQRGINIIRYNDGSSKKLFIKD